MIILSRYRLYKQESSTIDLPPKRIERLKSAQFLHVSHPYPLCYPCTSTSIYYLLLFSIPHYPSESARFKTLVIRKQWKELKSLPKRPQSFFLSALQLWACWISNNSAINYMQIGMNPTKLIERFPPGTKLWRSLNRLLRQREVLPLPSPLPPAMRGETIEEGAHGFSTGASFAVSAGDTEHGAGGCEGQAAGAPGGPSPASAATLRTK